MIFRDVEIDPLRIRDDGRVLYVVVDKKNSTMLGSLFDGSFDYKSVRYLCIELLEHVKTIDLSQIPLFPGVDRLGFSTFHQGIPKPIAIVVNFNQFAGCEHLDTLTLGHVPISLSTISAFRTLKSIHLASLGPIMQQIDLSSFQYLRDATIAGSSRPSLDLQLPTACKNLSINSFNKIEDYDFLNRYKWLTHLNLVLIRSLSKLELRLPSLKSLAIIEVRHLKEISCENVQLESLTVARCPSLSADDVVALCEKTQCRSLYLSLSARVEEQVRTRLSGGSTILNF